MWYHAGPITAFLLSRALKLDLSYDEVVFPLVFARNKLASKLKYRPIFIPKQFQEPIFRENLCLPGNLSIGTAMQDMCMARHEQSGLRAHASSLSGAGASARTSRHATSAARCHARDDQPSPSTITATKHFLTKKKKNDTYLYKNISNVQALRSLNISKGVIKGLFI